MHRARLTVLGVAAALVAGLLPGVAGAAPRPVCNLLTDPANDVTIKAPAYGRVPYADTAVDIRSLDVVSDAAGVGVTLRLGGIGTTSTSSTHTDLGVVNTDYRVFLTLESAGREFGFRVYGISDNAVGAAYGAAGAVWRFELGRYLNDAQHKYADESFGYYGPARGAVDPAKNEVRMSVSWAELKKYGYTRAKRDRMVKIWVRAADMWLAQSYEEDVTDPGNVRYEAAPRDDAMTKAAYPLGARSCAVKI